MDNKLYELMNWPKIEAIIYSEEENPHEILGAHVTENGVVIQTYQPAAEKVFVVLEKNGNKVEMELADEEGYFAVLLPGKSIPAYTYLLTDKEGNEWQEGDPYIYAPQITEQDAKKFNSGIHYEIYEKLGAHPMKIKGTEGVYFAVWAPNAVRVSVVGNFNQWDGRRHQMRKLQSCGIFELFIPRMKTGEIYKYEIRVKGGLLVLKSDPYANAAELRPGNASVVADISDFAWSDEAWIAERRKKDSHTAPISVYELHLGSFVKKEDPEEFYTYRELAPLVAEYVQNMNYTHIELLPVMEHPFDASWGYQVTGYYAPTSRYGKPEDFMYFMDYMHSKGIGVILDWVPAHFPRDMFGLASFDGTCLYEHQDPRKGAHPHWGTLIYNYGSPQVRNFLIANALFWVLKYHADGIRMDAVASMLYLDYGKKDGEWVANMYGGNENLEAVEFLKHLNSVFKKKGQGALVIAEESTAWPLVTEKVDKDGLGFDYKWNMGWMNDFLGFMQTDPLFRKGRYGELIFSMIYAYSEKFMLVFSHDEVVHGKGSMINKMPGTEEEKFANLRLAYGYMMTHPGKKLIFMGQDLAQYAEWSEEKSVEWELLKKPEHQQMNGYVKALNQFYQSQPALYRLDESSEGFEWINNISADESIIVFARKTKLPEEMLLIVCNFTPVVRDNYKIGVPYSGKYKEIFNSDSAEFGGSGETNPRLKQSKKEECDERENSIRIKVPPLGLTILKYSPLNEKLKDNRSAGKNRKKTVKAAEKKKSLKEELAEKIAQETSKN